MEENKNLPVSNAQIEEVLKKYSKEHHVSADEMVAITSEFVKGFEFLRNFKKAVSIYGSARLGFESDIYKQATLLASMLSKDGFTVITGGGPGIMEAANKGAFEAKGESVGLNIILKHEQEVNQYVNHAQEFKHFYIRKVMLAFASKAYIFFPGGFGTLDEMFEMTMLVQTQKIPPVPIILVDKDFWNPLLDWIKTCLFDKNKAIDEQDMQIYHVVDNADEAYQLIQKLTEEGKIKF